MLSIKLRQATEKDIPTLKNLWQICFGDRMRYIDVFFDNMFEARNTLIAEVGGRVAGVVYILNRTLNNKRFMYGYAIGVFPEFRGNKICEYMLNNIKEYAQKNDVLFGLHPANEKLSLFYQRIGLNEMYYLKEIDASDFTSGKKYILEDLTFDEFYKMQNTSHSNSVKWDKKALEYIFLNGEIVKKITLQEKSIYMVLNVDDNRIFVKETNATDDEVIEISESIKSHFNKKRLIFLLSSKSTLHGVVKPMIYGFSEKDTDVYMSLFLD